MKSAASLTASLIAQKGKAAPTEGMQPVGYEGRAIGHASQQEVPGITTITQKRPVGTGKRIAMTVRLDHEQHLRLRVFSAHQRRSSQEILALALDKYIDEHAPSALDAACSSLKS